MKLKVHIDTKGYDQKPSGKDLGGIKSRLQKNTTPSIVTLEELVQKIESGHTISPGIMSGMSAKDWREQQLFLVDIDNDNTGPILRPKDAKKICNEHDLSPAFYYQTFSYTKEKPKFRLAFVMDTPIHDDGMRKRIIETLVKLFPQSDKSCVNADRIFHGTNKRVVLLNESARISYEDILRVTFPTPNEKHHCNHASQPSERTDPELDILVRNFDLFGYMKKRNGTYRQNDGSVVFHNCEICGHHDNLMYVEDTNSFFCYSMNVGGSIIDYLIYSENLTQVQAIEKLKYELCEPQWPQPISFDEIKLPSFPLDSLPAPLSDWVEAVAKNTETPVDMAAVCALAVLSCAVQGKYRICPKRDYNEPLNLYFLIIANSGERKSAIVRMMTQPIYQYEKRENQRRHAIIEENQAQLNGWKKQIDILEREGKIDEAAKIRSQYHSLEENRVKSLRLVADDATPEAITSLLANNNGVLSLITTEGGIFDTLAGRYSNTVSIDTILKAYSGDPIRVDRKGREGEIINSPTLTMLLSAQDNVLSEIMRNEAFKSRGLTARILYCRPKSKMGLRSYETPDIPDDLKLSYVKLVSDLLELSYPTNGTPKDIRLSPMAQECAKHFHDWIEPQLVDGLEHMDGWGAKIVGNMSRIAGIIHCAKNRNTPDEIAVSSETMKQAIAIAKYFLKHAKCVYNLLGTDKAMRGAKQIIKKFQRQDESELTRYQIFRLCRGEFQRVEDLTPALDILVEYGYLKERKYSAPTGGRPRSSGYLLNPKFFGMRNSGLKAN